VKKYLTEGHIIDQNEYRQMRLISSVEVKGSAHIPIGTRQPTLPASSSM